MNMIYGLNTKTTLQHLIFLSNKNVVTVSKELKITPQQFTDWMKLRRPIPTERIIQLEKYFDIPANIFVDRNRYAKRLSVLDGIELEILVATIQIKDADMNRKTELECRIKQLKEDRQKQLRIARMAALLDENDETVMQRIDQFLDELEKK